MVRSWIRFPLSGLLVACSLPLLAISFLIAVLGTAGAALVPRLHRRKPSGGFGHRKPWAADQFRFEQAIEAYEALIDAHAWRDR